MKKAQTDSKKQYNKRYREKHRTELKLYSRKIRQEGKAKRDTEKQKETIAEWKKKHPERRRAHSRVWYAVKVGKLKKQPCRVCGDVKVHAHHEDYSKPLEVIWLCPTHHWQFDNKIGNRIC